MRMLSRVSFVYQLFLFVLYDKIGKKGIEKDKIEKLLSILNLKRKDLENLIELNIIIVDDYMSLSDLIIDEIEKELQMFSSYGLDKMGSSQKSYFELIKDNNLIISDELKNNPNIIDIVLPMVKGKCILFDESGSILPNK